MFKRLQPFLMVFFFFYGVNSCSKKAPQVEVDNKIYNVDTVRTIYNQEEEISYLEICLSTEYSPEIETDIVWLLIDVPLEEGLYVDDFTELHPKSSIWLNIFYEDNHENYWTSLLGEGSEVEVSKLKEETLDVEFHGLLANWNEYDSSTIEVKGILREIYISYDTNMVAYSYPEVKIVEKRFTNYLNAE